MTIDATRKQFLPARQVQQRYGVTRSTIHRWLRDPTLAMPQPVRRRKYLYWVEAELDAWDLACARLDPADTAALHKRFAKKEEAGPNDEAA